MEPFSWALKYEDIKINKYVNLSQLRFGVQHYENFYNSNRIHSVLQYRRRMIYIGELVIGKQWEQTKGLYTNHSIKSCPIGGEAHRFPGKPGIEFSIEASFHVFPVFSKITIQ